MKNLLEIKSQALEFEKNNFQYLQFVDSTDNFKQIFDHSALIFKTKVAEKIGYKTANFRTDLSLSKPKAKYGIISFKNFANLKEKLFNIGIAEEKSLNRPGLTYFKLPKAYSGAEMATLVKDLADQKKRLNKTITPKNPYPMLFVRILNLEKMLYENLRQTHAFARETIGAEIFNLATGALKMYLFYANADEKTKNQYLTKIRLDLKTIRFNLKTVENLNLIHAKNLERLLEEVVAIERIVVAEIKNAC